jgi:hypothetical protein
MTVTGNPGAAAPGTTLRTPTESALSERRIAVLVPCDNDEVAIANVIAVCRAAEPYAGIHG